MKRSTIDSKIVEAQAIAAEYRRAFPVWGYWRMNDYAADPAVSRYLKRRQMGWDITDFGCGDFKSRGLTILCLRNGIQGDAGERSYAEKMLLVDEMQETPFHFHSSKLEDIINAGGGNLMIEFLRPEDEQAPVDVRADGRSVRLRAHEPMRLTPGQSVTVDRGLYHRFYGEKGTGRCLAWEVSSINDDLTDNHFLEASARFTVVEEDTPIETPLWSEIPTGS